MRKVLPLLFLLAGCAGGPPIGVTKMDQEENTYELVYRTGPFTWSAPAPAVKQALMAKATEVCGPGGAAELDLNRPDYIGVEMIPRGYLHCR
jgi:hypothetical protein